MVNYLQSQVHGTVMGDLERRILDDMAVATCFKMVQLIAWALVCEICRLMQIFLTNYMCSGALLHAAAQGV